MAAPAPNQCENDFCYNQAVFTCPNCKVYSFCSNACADNEWKKVKQHPKDCMPSLTVDENPATTMGTVNPQQPGVQFITDHVMETVFGAFEPSDFGGAIPTVKGIETVMFDPNKFNDTVRITVEPQVATLFGQAVDVLYRRKGPDVGKWIESEKEAFWLLYEKIPLWVKPNGKKTARAAGLPTSSISMVPMIWFISFTDMNYQRALELRSIRLAGGRVAGEDASLGRQQQNYQAPTLTQSNQNPQQQQSHQPQWSSPQNQVQAHQQNYQTASGVQGQQYRPQQPQPQHQYQPQQQLQGPQQQSVQYGRQPSPQPNYQQPQQQHNAQVQIPAAQQVQYLGAPQGQQQNRLAGSQQPQQQYYQQQGPQQQYQRAPQQHYQQAPQQQYQQAQQPQYQQFPQQQYPQAPQQQYQQAPQQQYQYANYQPPAQAYPQQGGPGQPSQAYMPPQPAANQASGSGQKKPSFFSRLFK